MATYTEQGDSFVPDKPRLFSDKRLTELGPIQNFDVAPDGKRLIVLLPVQGAEDQKKQNHVTFLLNFFDELRRRVPTGTK